MEIVFKANRQHIDIDSGASENLKMIHNDLIHQSAPDIQKKLQKVEGALGMSVSHLVEIAFKVFKGGDQVQERKGQKMRQAVLTGGCSGPGPPHSPPPGTVPCKVGCLGPKPQTLGDMPQWHPTKVPTASRNDTGEKNTQPKPSPRKRPPAHRSPDARDHW